ncbi:MAG TPA: hypothetical protein VII95_19705 [Terriglobales bacterium]
MGNTIHVARDGEEALAFLADCEAGVNGGEGAMPRHMLLDLKLPKVDGHEVLRQTKSNPATKMIPVVVLTSSKQDEDMLKDYLRALLVQSAHYILGRFGPESVAAAKFSLRNE